MGNQYDAIPTQPANGETLKTKTPVHDVDGHRRRNSGNNSPSAPVTQVKCSYMEHVVELGDSNPRPSHCERDALPTAP